MADQFVDILMVLTSARDQWITSKQFIDIAELRRNAIRTVAESEFKKGRFKS